MNPLSARKWLRPGIGIKRWLLLLCFGIGITTLSMALILLQLVPAASQFVSVRSAETLLMLALGIALVIIAIVYLTRALLAPYRRVTQGSVIDLMTDYSERSKGLRVVAIGGGTGLPATLRGLKPYTGNITAIVTVADDGGSSGRLRRELGVLPPGDLRNNIVALSDDESLMARLFQYRFESGDLQGHAFGNLFIVALASVVGQGRSDRNELAEALVEIARVLNIRGRVLPATVDDVSLVATMTLNDSGQTITVMGESTIETIAGSVSMVALQPVTAVAYPPSLEAIMSADLIVIGPGSLYTSIIPNLLAVGMADALRASRAYKIYVCNVATQPVETEGYHVADHVMALEKHVGRGVFQAIIANNNTPTANAGQNTHYVGLIPPNHEILQRYEVRYTDLTDEVRPWRHDPQKLGKAIIELARTRDA